MDQIRNGFRAWGWIAIAAAAAMWGWEFMTRVAFDGGPLFVFLCGIVLLGLNR